MRSIARCGLFLDGRRGQEGQISKGQGWTPTVVSPGCGVCCRLGIEGLEVVIVEVGAVVEGEVS